MKQFKANSAKKIIFLGKNKTKTKSKKSTMFNVLNPEPSAILDDGKYIMYQGIVETCLLCFVPGNIAYLCFCVAFYFVFNLADKIAVIQ